MLQSCFLVLDGTQMSPKNTSAVLRFDSVFISLAVVFLLCSSQRLPIKQRGQCWHLFFVYKNYFWKKSRIDVTNVRTHSDMHPCPTHLFPARTHSFKLQYETPKTQSSLNVCYKRTAGCFQSTLFSVRFYVPNGSPALRGLFLSSSHHISHLDWDILPRDWTKRLIAVEASINW